MIFILMIIIGVALYIIFSDSHSSPQTQSPINPEETNQLHVVNRMNEPLLTTRYLGSKVTIYQKKLIWEFMLQRKIIPLSQIASIEDGGFGMASIKLETTGGKRLMIPVALNIKKRVQDIVIDLQNG